MCQKLPMSTLMSTMNTKVEMVRAELCPKQMVLAIGPRLVGIAVSLNMSLVPPLRLSYQ